MKGSKNPKHNPPLTLPDSGELRDADGLLIDEYSDDSLTTPEGNDALDDPAVLTSDRFLDTVADDVDGIAEMELVNARESALGDGARRSRKDQGTRDESREPHSADDLQRVTVGSKARRAAASKEEQAHGEDLLDDPSKA